MLLHTTQFLGIDDPVFNDFDTAKVVILPFPYEEGVSYGRGTALAPQAVLDASAYLEFYDEVLNVEPFRIGICTLLAPSIPQNAGEMREVIYQASRKLLKQKKFVIVIGGDHSITSGYVQAVQKQFGQVSVIQLDAHADLRDSYEGSKLSHASVMARIREITPYTLQIGIRSLSSEEAQLIRNEKLNFFPMHTFRQHPGRVYDAVRKLPDPVFITLDVDVLDWSVIASTGTPEPGGMLWDEAMALLRHIFMVKDVIGGDVVELSYTEHDQNSPFAVAKLIYKMIGFKYFVGNSHENAEKSLSSYIV